MVGGRCCVLCVVGSRCCVLCVVGGRCCVLCVVGSRCCVLCMVGSRCCVPQPGSGGDTPGTETMTRMGILLAACATLAQSVETLAL